MAEALEKYKKLGIYDIIELDITQKYMPKKKKEEDNINKLKEDLNMTKASSVNSNESNASNVSQSTAATKTSSNNNKVEISLKKYFEPSYRSEHVNKREPTEDEIIAAFKFYE